MPVNDDHNSCPISADVQETVSTQSPAASTEDHSESACSAPTSNAVPEKVRYGAPDGPRKQREHFDGGDPLDYPGHEAIAQFHATPKKFVKIRTRNRRVGADQN